MFGQSFLLTSITLNLTRRVTYCANRVFGASPREASRIADDVALSAAGTVAAMSSVLTADLPGAALSAGYLAVESGEAERRRSEGER